MIVVVHLYPILVFGTQYLEDFGLFKNVSKRLSCFSWVFGICLCKSFTAEIIPNKENGLT